MPPPEGAGFALLGDAPYSEEQAVRLDAVIDEMNAERLAFVAHLGDITASTDCSDAWLAARQRQFARIRHPFVLLPGDNEWVDCHRGGFDPLERLETWRSLFCHRTKGFPTEVQSDEYCEHVRWEIENVLFVTLNVPGSNNNLGRTARMDSEHLARMKSVLAWLNEAAQLASDRNQTVVILMHANPFDRWGRPDGFAALRSRLEALAAERPGRVVLAHGDTHIQRIDEPRPGLRRVEVYGAPFVNWVRGTLRDGEVRF